jgi:hypothetical protein
VLTLIARPPLATTLPRAPGIARMVTDLPHVLGTCRRKAARAVLL